MTETTTGGELKARVAEKLNRDYENAYVRLREVNTKIRNLSSELKRDALDMITDAQSDRTAPFFRSSVTGILDVVDVARDLQRAYEERQSYVIRIDYLEEQAAEWRVVLDARDEK